MLRVIQMSLGFGVGLLIMLWAWSLPVHWRDLDVALLPHLSNKGDSLQETERRALLDGNSAIWRWSRHVQQVGEGASQMPEHVARLEWQLTWEQQLAVDSSFWYQTYPSDMLMEDRVRSLALNTWPTESVDLVERVRSLQELRGLQLFPPPTSHAARPWLASLELLVWLSQNQGLTSMMEQQISLTIAGTAAEDDQLRGEAIRRMEGFLISLLSLGRRYHWDELPVISRSMSQMEDAAGLAQMVAQFPEDRAGIGLSIYYLGRVHPLLTYRNLYPETWRDDLRVVLEYGRYPVRQMVLHELALYKGFLGEWSQWGRERTFLANRPAANAIVEQPLYWQRVKVGALFVAALFISLGLAAFGRLRPMVRRQRIPWWNPLLLVRQLAITLVIGGILLWLCEPGILRTPQKDHLLQQASLQFQFPSDSVLTEENHMIPEFDALTLFMLGLFFSLQFLIYIIGLLKIAQIRRLQLEPSIKLELLDNEENLFDCGLYLGIGGTVVALVLLAMHILQPSLVAAYSSTLFGILFVSLLKVYHVRPFRRQLLLNRENIVAL